MTLLYSVNIRKSTDMSVYLQLCNIAQKTPCRLGKVYNERIGFMKIQSFDSFLASLDLSQIKESAEKHFKDAFPEDQTIVSHEEMLRKYAERSSQAYSEFVVSLLRSYHEWLQSQM